MFYTPIHNEFKARLNELHESGDSYLNKADLGIQLCNDALTKLRRALGEHSFDSEVSEILFFKEIKPQTMCYLVLYTEIRSCELKLPKYGLENRFEFLEMELSRVNSFFDHHLD
ncbi:MAG: RteC domain-containing protein, partial [Allomuricauda sp.]